jgi:esterase/lipase
VHAGAVIVFTGTTPYHRIMIFLYTLLAIIGLLLIVFIAGPRPTLNATAPKTRVPESLTGVDLAHWMVDSEAQVSNIIDGTEARISWHDSKAPAKTPLCFLYVHGFSASRQETAPVTQLLAQRYHANIFDARLEGHGVGHDGMLSPAESWLQSMVDAWDVASKLGERVVIVATSTGAPLSIWLASQPGVADKLQAILLMSPNFKVRSPFGFLLTWPWASHWVQLVIGKTHEWEPETKAHGLYWTSRYSTLALIEMQKTVDWLKTQNLGDFKTPMALMYMRNDSTIDPEAAVQALNLWGSDLKQLIPVTLDGETAEHVFTGHLGGPHRTAWTVDQFAQFLETTFA